ncbi:50S ribosomal protein L17 [Candidatus Uhrbacteria bacterium CG_4_9_14_3_um_filter_41_35]|uniref:Large ribosomal subunit protein bL17 n=1 Tax=Candidatus Uhrbacteria bacterium CG_4_9_14_3_um_filter_41_35 TaxID=1975034 RepID=A0A2M7XFR7_9BACT|nr:MAG: 50S ribosomal protein L17 [Candidatus Uhrbacteria bacterium CG11_big_fil_rev_8_21_14_0_20_41_9]PJA46576.1 MAG: 50S ribosomal protein L17 [Candidatus Uhrbacteria bacterium CG_4_9_14_3_um_filter_41_35]
MRHRNTTKTLKRKVSARKALLRDLATSVIIYDRIKLTLGKAKVTQQVVEKLITAAKKDNLAARRNLLAFFTTEQPVNKLLEVIVPKYKDRNGGYTRIVKMGHRKGDGAEVVILELV